MNRRREPRYIRRGLAAAALFALVGVACTLTEDEEPPSDSFALPARPNVVLVVVDALRRDHLGVYGYPKPTSPFLDALAAEGVLAWDAWSQAPQTFVSTATLFSSRRFPLVFEDHRYERVWGLHEANLTLAEVLRDAGYSTFAAFTNPHHHPASGFPQGFEESVYLTAKHRAYGRGVDVYRRFFEWLDTAPAERPFFAYLHFMEVHNPYRPPQKLQRLFVERKGKLLSLERSPDDPTPSAEDLAYTVALYDGEIRFVDSILGEIVGELRSRGLWERTLFVFTADHGDEFMDHGGLGHGRTLYPEMLRIPMLFAGAGLAERPARLEGLVRNLDLAPTIAAAAGTSPDTLEGTSLLEAITGGKASYAESSYGRGVSLRSLVDERWLFVADVSDGERWLYDRRSDPGATTDVAAEHPEVVRRLAGRVAELEKEHRKVERLARRLGKDGDGADEEVIRQLKALGYLADG